MPLTWACNAEGTNFAPKTLESIVALLLDHGALVDVPDEYACGWTALHYAAANGNLEIIDMLLGAHASLDSRTTIAATSVST